MFKDFLPWLLLSFIMGIIVILKVAGKDKKINISSIKPLVTQKIDFLETKKLRDNIKNFILDSGMIIKEENDTAILVDSKSISFFHWGFYYLIKINKDNIEVGIFGKGANPPSFKSQKKRLNAFVLSIKDKIG